MIQTKVESSNIKQVGWENETLHVEFHNGGLYRYLDVPFSVYEELVKSSSVGKHFITEVKPRYVVEKVDVCVFAG